MELLYANFWNIIGDLPKIDHIIADPLYDRPLDFNLLKSICPGNIVLFNAVDKPFFPIRPKIDHKHLWIKPPSTKNVSKNPSCFIEEIRVHRQGPVFNANLHWSNYRGIFEDTLIWKARHEFEKPESLLIKFVAMYTRPGDVILDPFMGSGTTGAACLALGRQFIGIECEKEYYDLAYARLVQRKIAV